MATYVCIRELRRTWSPERPTLLTVGKLYTSYRPVPACIWSDKRSTLQITRLIKDGYLMEVE